MILTLLSVPHHRVLFPDELRPWLKEDDDWLSFTEEDIASNFFKDVKFKRVEPNNLIMTCGMIKVLMKRTIYVTVFFFSFVMCVKST